MGHGGIEIDGAVVGIGGQSDADGLPVVVGVFIAGCRYVVAGNEPRQLQLASLAIGQCSHGHLWDNHALGFRDGNGRAVQPRHLLGFAGAGTCAVHIP